VPNQWRRRERGEDKRIRRRLPPVDRKKRGTRKG
jgi:hypothetical protein